VQGVVGAMVEPEDIAWLRGLPVPSAFQAAGDVPHRVTSDYRQMMATAVRHLAERGCRTVGLLTHVAPEAAVLLPPGDQLHESFQRAVAETGVATTEAWVPPPSGDGSLAACGYAQFHQLWSLPERPDGLAVFPDVVARGVIQAIGERGVQVPRDVRLVLHRNRELEFFCPYPVDWLELRVTDVARALLDLIIQQLAGEPAPSVFPAMRIVHGGPR